MSLSLAISPSGQPLIEDSPEVTPAAVSADAMSAAAIERIKEAFRTGTGAGLLHLGTAELRSSLPVSLGLARRLSEAYLTRLSHTPGLESTTQIEPISPQSAELATLVLQAPPLKGLEYLTTDVLAAWWAELDHCVRSDIKQSGDTAANYLHARNPLWRMVGRVTFHLAENKRDEQNPFAFMATYTHRLSAQGAVQHLPLSRALQEYSGSDSRQTLLALLTPIQKAADQSPWIKELVESGSIYQAQAWVPKQAYRFLQDLPLMESSGLVVRVPNWWKGTRPPRPVVSVKIGDAAKSTLSASTLLDFSARVTLEGQSVTDEELNELLASTGGLVRLRGQWVEVDRDQLSRALEHWKDVERAAGGGGITFFEGMRLLAGADFSQTTDPAHAEQIRQWSGLQPGEWLDRTLAELRDPDHLGNTAPPSLQAELRPYQQAGVNWLRFMTKLGLGACLADDMGLGKTIQMISLLLHAHEARSSQSKDVKPSLLVVPASLIANWRAELRRFAPSLWVVVEHPSEPAINQIDVETGKQVTPDLVITTYGMLGRIESLRSKHWHMVILDEAQAIKNSGTRQAKSVRELKATSRIALTGTPVENRLSDLWALFDFLNPGLLGTAKEFSRFCKAMANEPAHGYAPLRALVKPYILRRMKTDKKIIADLPDKTEVRTFCGLSKAQAVLYQQAVDDLSRQLNAVDGIQRRGIVLASLMRLKQICNHPSQWLGDGGYEPARSAKFLRLADLCEELSSRQEKALIFTQYREICDPLAAFLEGVFGRSGLVLHGGTTVPKRREMVNAFQLEGGPPFFVLSIKAGGTGLNLTAASQVIHFDRWWNPAVENQATDRAFRIGQKRNVLVHKFVCRGTVEERIDALIIEKSSLSQDLLDGGTERMLTEMNNRELLDFVALDVGKAAAE